MEVKIRFTFQIHSFCWIQKKCICHCMEVYSTLQDNGICIYDTMKAYIMTATGEHLKYSTSKPCVQHLCVASYQARRSLVYVTVSLCVY